MSRPTRLLLTLAAVAFVLSICWSIWFETLAPLLAQGDYLRVSLNLVGIPILLAGTSVFVWGGTLFVRNTVLLFRDQAFVQSMAAVRQRPSPEAVREARRLQLRAFGQAWSRGLRLMALGFGLIAVGGFIINL